MENENSITEVGLGMKDFNRVIDTLPAGRERFCRRENSFFG
jgi:hypothetical protein